MAKRKTVDGGSIDAIVKTAATVTVANVIAMVAKTTGAYVPGHWAVGRFTGRRIVAFQNWMLVENVNWKLDDLQLAFVMSVEFPAGRGRAFSLNAFPGLRVAPNAAGIRDAITIIRGIRGEWNRNGHGDPAGKPKTESVSYGTRRFDIPVAPVVVAPVVAPVVKTRVRKTA